MKPQFSVFNFTVKNQTNAGIDIYIDGYIVDSPTLEIMREYWGDETSVSYKSFRDSIPADVKTINLYVNSGGGHVGDAMAIHDFLADLENKGVTVNREGRGIVASAATYLVMGKNSKLSENCLFMIHNVSGFAYGDVNEIENQAKALRKFNDLIVNFYANKTGKSATVIGNLMNKETWMDAQEAKENGFVASIGGQAKITNKIDTEHWPFRNTAMLNTYNSFTQSNSSDMVNKKTLSDVISNAFEGLKKALNLDNKTPGTEQAMNDFTTAVVDAIAQNSGPDDEALNTMIKDGVTNALAELQNVPAPITTAISDATNGFMTKEDLNKELNTFKNNLTNSLIQKLGNKTTETTTEEKKETTDRKRLNNRYSGKDLSQ